MLSSELKQCGTHPQKAMAQATAAGVFQVRANMAPDKPAIKIAMIFIIVDLSIRARSVSALDRIECN